MSLFFIDFIVSITRQIMTGSTCGPAAVSARSQLGIGLFSNACPCTAAQDSCERRFSEFCPNCLIMRGLIKDFPREMSSCLSPHWHLLSWI